PLRAASEIHWITCRGPMGSDSLVEAGYPLSSLEIASSPPVATSSDDTKLACREFGNRGAELIVFCGGGGTCRDVIDAIDRRIPILRSEEHTSELQSRFDLVCRLLLEKKKHRGPADVP